ncbi:dipeptide ABC transporter ATP-binding protein [Streptomyces sp. NPDC020800]|uniref:dipeptide ABC transporter ATP-binding protein n=1 Tax=Streptomyces sp. NPDC020800 TaxID=3365092 RepID=UPI003790F4B7
MSQPPDGETSPAPLLQVRDLRVSFPTPTGKIRAVDGVSFTVEAGRTLGLVGESGSGKSVTSLAVMGLHRQAHVTGSVTLSGQELIGMPDRELAQVRGQRMAMIFQDPLSSLHPYYTVGEQIAEAYRHHFGAGRAAARRKAVEMLGEVGIPRPARRASEYPHQFSGGMRQRVMIAIALTCEPDLLIADEPTTALDVTVQAQILELLARIQQDRGLGVIAITHDLGVVARVAHDVLVMYGGRAAEQAPVGRIFAGPVHPYTRGLLDSLPRLDDPDDAPLQAIPGSPPSLAEPTAGCPFSPRCFRAATGDSAQQARCAEQQPPFEIVVKGHRAACHLPLTPVHPPANLRHQVAPSPSEGALWTRPNEPAPQPAGAGMPGDDTAAQPLLSVRDLVKTFPGRRTRTGRPGPPVRAVDGVSFDLEAGETLGLVGESGCGKSTTSRLIVRLLEPTEGSVLFDGTDISHLTQRQLRPVRRHIQMAFQDPYASLNPRQRVSRIIADPLLVQGVPTDEARHRAAELMALVGLIPEHLDRYPHEFSGGQAQRIGIARALATRPRLIIADEPVSALDVSVQAQVINLLKGLQEELDLTCVFVAHDLSVVKRICTRVAVMYLGRIVEIGDKKDVYGNPAHPYTRALLSAVPTPDPVHERMRERIILRGDPPDPAAPPSGCVFHPRCPKAQDVCRVERPVLRPAGAAQAACHFPETQ